MIPKVKLLDLSDAEFKRLNNCTCHPDGCKRCCMKITNKPCILLSVRNGKDWIKASYPDMDVSVGVLLKHKVIKKWDGVT